MAEAKRTTEDIQREIAEVELQTKQFNLAQAKRTNEDFVARDQQRRKANAQRMTELKQGREGRAQLVRLCRHKSGGTPDNILKGGGIGSFSVITRALMPDGVTIFLQCLRCPLQMYGRKNQHLEPASLKLQKTDPAKYAEMVEFNRLLELSEDTAPTKNEIRGPTFLFKNADGVPFIPELV